MSFPSQATPSELLNSYKGKHFTELPTPSLVVNVDRFKANSEKMLENAARIGADFRAHVKTHKTVEGTRLQLGSGKNKTSKIVVSTLAEAWKLIPLVKEGLIDDLHFSLPVVESRLSELHALSLQVPKLRIMLDHVDQLDTLVKFNKSNGITKKWSIFVKINMGTDRAGLINGTDALSDAIRMFSVPEVEKAVEVYGFYCHAGHSYSSKSETSAKDFLLQEIRHANAAAKQAVQVNPDLNLQISVGATPTAHASEILTAEELKQEIGQLYGSLELHAGNYIFCDLQQVATGCVSHDDVSCRVVAEVVSTYNGRGDKSPGEQLVNTGVIALGREFGPLPGHGLVVEPKGYGNWIVGRLSQEHGILTPLDDLAKFIPHGTKVSIYPQHSCITAAAYSHYFVTGEDGIVKDVWVPVKGW